jgi:hypothetical protein
MPYDNGNARANSHVLVGEYLRPSKPSMAAAANGGSTFVTIDYVMELS